MQNIRSLPKSIFLMLGLLMVGAIYTINQPSFPISEPWAIVVLACIYGIAAYMSGLSGFGFSAIGCLSLIVLPPTQGITILMTLSLITQTLSLKSLSKELRQYAEPLNRPNGVGSYLAGGAVGMPLGLKILATFGAKFLMGGLGVLLVGYSVYSLFKPNTFTLKDKSPSMQRGFIVGFAGGVVGGFSAFPGSALVVWNGLIGLSKEKSRALVQPYILFMQVIGIVLLLIARPHTFNGEFWSLLTMALPFAILGNQIGVNGFRNISTLVFQRITLIALGISGLGLLLKLAIV